MTADDPAQPAPAALWIASALATLRARAWFIALVAALGLLAAVVYLRTADYTYTASLKVAPAPSSGREASGLGALSSLASLTGASIEAAPASPFRLFLEGINTREVAAILAQDERLMQTIFADEWDARARAWHEPKGTAYTLRRSINRLAGVPADPWTPPDAARLQGWINSNVRVDQSPKTPIVTISLAATDPAFAKTFLVRLHHSVDAWLRNRTLDRTAINIAYLNQRVPTVSLADHRQALFVTLGDQQQRDMTARNPAAFAAEPFGSAVASAKPTSPQQLPLLLLSVVLGTFAGAILALVIPRRA